MRPRDLLITARRLVGKGKGKPRQSDLRRAESSAYYAAFHFLARCCANYLVGTNSKTRSKHAWRQVYRSLDHGPSKNACVDGAISKFPPAIQEFDILGGYLGITQLADGRTERVLLSPAQVRALLAFYDECAKQKEGGPGR